jgi:hypothetical protein
LVGLYIPLLEREKESLTEEEKFFMRIYDTALKLFGKLLSNLNGGEKRRAGSVGAFLRGDLSLASFKTTWETMEAQDTGQKDQVQRDQPEKKEESKKTTEAAGTKVDDTGPKKPPSPEISGGDQKGGPEPSPKSKLGVNAEKEIFISYAWGDEREEIVNQLDRVLQEKGITIIRDKRDLGFKGRIQEFMERIGRGKCVIVVISDKYLKSENCMFELVQIAKNGKFYNRIFPIVLTDAQIYKPVDRIKYVKYWEDEIKKLDDEMKGVSSANLQGFREAIDQYTEIRETIARLTNIIRDMNTLTPEIHSESGFEELFKAIEPKMAE